MNDYETRLKRQLEREEQTHLSGLNKYNKNELRNRKIANGSRNSFGLALIKTRLELVMEEIERLMKLDVSVHCVERREALNRCTALDLDGKPHELMKVDVWALIGLQETLNNLFNPNLTKTKEQGKYGGTRNLCAKKSLSGLEAYIGELINRQMCLQTLKLVFPNWYSFADKKAQFANEGSTRSTPQYYNKRMQRLINKKVNKLIDDGDLSGAELIRNSKPWTSMECKIIGNLVVTAVLAANADLLRLKLSTHNNKKRYDIELTELGQQYEKQIRTQVGQYANEPLPMLIEPGEVSNESMGGYLNELFRTKEESHKGEMILGDQHLEVLNKQQRVKFEINPFTLALLHRLKDEQKELGKFSIFIHESNPDPTVNLGLAAIIDPAEKNAALKKLSKEQRKDANRAANLEHERRIDQAVKNRSSETLLRMSETVSNDGYFHIPVKADFRGRFYGRVPFLNFQGTDVGKYLLRFHERTPVDKRTRFWLKIGIANAAGMDKKTWDQRVNWFDKNKENIINVGNMLTTGNFEAAYEFLKDIDDPFCFAALSNEYTKIFVDKTQTYSQVFVTIDASCSGTSIFNAWRLNRTGAIKTNLIDTNKVEDIYLAVWDEIKRLAPDKAFRASFLKRLEKSKLLRKMMKSVYVPASYASPKGEQLMKLKAYNNNELKEAGLQFKPKELEIVLKLWPEALDNIASINSVVSWFQGRTKEILDSGKSEIVCTNSVGSKMILRYPKSNLRRINVLGGGSATTRRISIQEPTKKPDKKKLLSSITANVTHMTDAAVLCEALQQLSDQPFVAIHDAVGFAPSQALDEAKEKLNQGMRLATNKRSIWDTFRLDNDLPLDPTTEGPIIGDFDPILIDSSSFLFS